MILVLENRNEPPLSIGTKSSPSFEVTMKSRVMKKYELPEKCEFDGIFW